MNSTSVSAVKIIDSEFGEKLAVKGPVNGCKWWDELLERVAALCDTALELGEKQGYANCHKIHKDKIMKPETEGTNDAEGCAHLNICKYYETKEK